MRLWKNLNKARDFESMFDKLDDYGEIKIIEQKIGVDAAIKIAPVKTISCCLAAAGSYCTEQDLKFWIKKLTLWQKVKRFFKGRTQ